jgi:lysophospholipase L1-like esterase
MTLRVITAGNSVTISVATGETVYLINGASDSATLEILTWTLSRETVTSNHHGAATYGPFGASDVIITAVVGSVWYELGTGSATSLPLGSGVTRQLANRCYTPQAYAASQKQLMSRMTHRALTNITNIALVYAGWYMSTAVETAQGGDASITASVEYPAGTFTRILFSGNSQGTLRNNTNTVSDSATIDIADGDTFWVRTWVSNPTGIIYDGIHVAITGDGFVSSSTTTDDLTLGGTVTQATVNMYGPSAIVGESGKRAVAIVGDSIARGYTETASIGQIGYIARSLTRTPHINVAALSDSAYGFMSYSTNRRALAAYCTDAVMQFGTNDLLGNTAATVISRLQSAIALLTDNLVYVCTITPRTTSTDSWVTTANQTVTADEANRLLVNTAIRANLVGSSGCFDASDALESSRNSGKYSVDVGVSFLARTNDGVHPNSLGHTFIALSGAVNQSMFGY